MSAPSSLDMLNFSVEKVAQLVQAHFPRATWLVRPDEKQGFFGNVIFPDEPKAYPQGPITVHGPVTYPAYGPTAGRALFNALSKAVFEREKAEVEKVH